MVKKYLVILSLVLVGCTSEQESRLIESCTDNYYVTGLFDKTTGERITAKSDSSLYLQVLGTCMEKVDMYVDGYRVSPKIEGSDLQIYVFKGGSALKTFYKKKLECEINPGKCS